MGANFEGGVALVTGAGAGIGRATATAFGRDGAKVVVADVNKESAEETVDMIRQAGGDATAVRVDVSNTSDVRELVKRAIEVYHRLDFAHNNAGIGTPVTARLADQEEEAFDRYININLKGVWLCMKYEIPCMLNQGGGSIVNTSSSAGLHGSALGTSPYIASKHGVVGLTQAAAQQYARQGIRVNAVCPGPVRTAMLEDAIKNPEVEEKAKTLIPMGRIGMPEDVAETVLWLCSETASYVSGQSILLAGGLLP